MSYLAPAEDVSPLLPAEAVVVPDDGHERGCPVALSLDRFGLSVRLGRERVAFRLEDLDAVELFELYLRIDVGTGVLQVPREAFRSRSPDEICDLLHQIIGE